MKEKDISKYISLYNLYELGIVIYGRDKRKIANGKSNSKICEYYGV